MKVDTVERFQGSEREIMIISLTASSAGQMAQIESLSLDESVDRKLNVMITRARDHLYIVGNQQMMEHARYYRKLMAAIRRSGEVIPFADVLQSNQNER